MAIPLSPDQRAALELGHIQAASLVRLTIEATQYRFWSGFEPLVWRGLGYVAAGALAEIAAYQSADGTETRGLEIRLDGTRLAHPDATDPAAILATAASMRYKGRPVEVAYLIFGADAKPLFEIPVFRGIIDLISHE